MMPPAMKQGVLTTGPPILIYFTRGYYEGFPRSAGGKEPTCQCRRHKICRLNPWVGKIPCRRRAWRPTPVFLPAESHRQRNLAGYSPYGHKESDMMEEHACMVIMNPIMCQAVLEDEGSMGNKANNHNNNNNNKISESLSSQSCPLGRRTHCQRQRLIAPGVCQACSHLNAIVSATPSARSTSPHSFPWPTLRSHLLQEALSDHPV